MGRPAEQRVVKGEEAGEEGPSSSDAEPDLTKWTKGRIFIAFWLLGMCNNYIYVIMLSAAHDVISKVEHENNVTIVVEPANVTYARNCNQLSTGAILLADIIPTLFVKLFCPFLPFLVHVRLGFAVATGILALVMVGLADSIIIALVGVCFASFNSGLGEITLLAYSTLFPLFAVAAWSSGTGGAGLVGAFAYAGMTQGGLTPEMTLFISIIFPLLQGVAFWLILKHPSGKGRADSTESIIVPDGVHKKEKPTTNRKIKSALSKLWEDLRFVPQLLPYMIPVGLVYFFEYVINSGLFELLEFENTRMDRSSQFRWYNVMYQIGVFISRSSVTWIHIEKVWIMAVLQAFNVILLTCDAIYGFIPNVWIMFAIIFWEGLLGGAAYVNTFYQLSYKVPEERRLFALSIASVADTFGIVSAGLASFPIHDAICALPLDPVFRNTAARGAAELNLQGSLAAQLKRNWLAVILGLLGFFSGIVLTVWNEARAVSVSKALEEAIQTITPVYDSSILDQSLEGRLLYLTGVLSVQEPLTEADYGVSVLAVKLKRRVQMYQWVEEKLENIDGDGNFVSDDYFYFKEWKDKLIDSSLFHTTMSHWNPRNFPVKNLVQVSEKASLGGYELGAELKEKFTSYVEITSDERPERKDIKLHAGLYYHSVDVWNPEIGDIRIQFSYAGQQGQVLTVVAKLEPGGVLVPYNATSGSTLLVLRLGVVSLEDIIALESGENKLQTWLYRGASWGLMYLGCICLSNVTHALLIRSRLLRQLLPPGHASVKMTVSMSASLLMTSLAWMWYRPYLGGTLILVTMFFLICSRYFSQDNPGSGYRRL